MARIVALKAEKRIALIGRMKNRFTRPDDFDAEDAEIAVQFAAAEIFPQVSPQ